MFVPLFGNTPAGTSSVCLFPDADYLPLPLCSTLETCPKRIINDATGPRRIVIDAFGNVVPVRLAMPDACFVFCLSVLRC